MFAGTLAAAVGVPYVMNEPEWRSKLDQVLKAVTPSESGAGDTTSEYGAGGYLSGAGEWPPGAVSYTPDSPLPFGQSVPPAGQPVTGPSVQDFAAILRFDITPQWVLANWPRVTTVLSEYELEGLRVPVVSGTRLDDVAGSLTYYYDRQQQLQRISLEGHTGDARRLADHVQRYLNLKPEPSLYAGMLLAKWNGVAKSALIIRHAPVIRGDSPHTRFEIRMELNRPDLHYRLSEPMLRELEQGRHSARWGT